MSFCGTTAMSCLSASKWACRSCPLTSTPPSSGAVRPLRADRSVDLPEPDGPSRQTNSCGRMTSVMSSRRVRGLPVSRLVTTRRTLRATSSTLSERVRGTNAWPVNSNA